jgi:hypothetical protein
VAGRRKRRKKGLTDEVDELVLADGAAGDDEHAGEDAGEVRGGRHGRRLKKQCERNASWFLAR